MTLTAIPVVLAVARRVLLTSASATDDAKVVTVSGTDRNGNPITEAVALLNATPPYTKQDFKTVTAVTTATTTVGTVSVGTNGIGSTRWIVLDSNRHVFNCGIAVNLNAVVANFTVEYTLDPVDKSFVDSATGGDGDSSLVGAASTTFTTPVATTLTGFSGLTADTWGSATIPSRAVRLTINSGALTVGPRITVLQQGL